MQHADSTARTRPSQEAILRALERLSETERRRTRLASGFFTVVTSPAQDEFAGLDRLDRAELDEDEG